jgi:hypothetical protein
MVPPVKMSAMRGKVAMKNPSFFLVRTTISYPAMSSSSSDFEFRERFERTGAFERLGRFERSKYAVANDHL